MMNALFYGPVARFAAFAVLAACASPAVAADRTALRLGITSEPGSLSPLFTLDDYANAIERLIFDVLITVDRDGRTLRPHLAAEIPSRRNGGISADGRTLTYRLRRNVKWHDGVPFTSKDVAFSYRAIMNPANNVPNRHGYDQITSVATPDPYTVVFRFKQPYAPALTTLFSDSEPSPILPEHLLARFANLNTVDFNSQPIGTGPYKVTRWDRGQSIELEANGDYYLGKPKIDRISVRFAPDENTLVTQMQTGESDVFAEMSANAYGRLRHIPGVRVALTDTHGATNLLLNTSHDELRDIRVRRAIAASIDKKAIVDNFVYGAGTIATADLPPFMWAHDPRVTAQGYDPARSRALLRESGWISSNGGIVNKGGKPLTLTFAYSQNNAAERLIAVQIQSYLRAVGVDAQLKGYAAQMMFNAYAAGGIYQAGKFDIALYTMTLAADPDSSGRFTCGAIPPNGQNYSRYCTPEMDAAQLQPLRTFDETKRRRDYFRSQALLARDVPIVFLYWPKNIDGYSARLGGFAPNPVVPTWNAQDWYWLPAAPP